MSHDRYDNLSESPSPDLSARPTAAHAEARPRPPGPVHRADDPLDRPSRRRATMSPDQRMRLRTAALLATERYPGPVGELLARELMIWEDFGHRFGAHSLVSQLVTHILDDGVVDRACVEAADDDTAA
jgi:hypothetical protein